jgi:hypothetical protein
MEMDGTPQGPDSKCRGDCDCDGDVDVTDFAGFGQCVTGPFGDPAEVTCGCYEFDEDPDVDLVDFREMQAVFGR